MPKPLKEGGSFVITKDYRTSFFGKVLKQGTGVLVTRVYKGWTGVYADVRLKDGTFVRKIPFEYFRG
jgi:uncharacterized Zn ribbon protein